MAEEYIKRSDALNEINDHCVMAPVWNKLLALTAINQIPNADVAPVIHAKWEPRKDFRGFVTCSACHECNVYDDWSVSGKWKYCPDCGAKMDLEVETDADN